MSIEGRRIALQARHEELDKRIENLLTHPYHSNAEVADLKKQKLAIKDEMVRISEEA